MTSPRGGLPLLAPMSEVAGRMSVQVGAHYLEKEPGGAGETQTPILPGALANAIFDAVGVRLREMPFTPSRLQRALASR